MDNGFDSSSNSRPPNAPMEQIHAPFFDETPHAPETWYPEAQEDPGSFVLHSIHPEYAHPIEYAGQSHDSYLHPIHGYLMPPMPNQQGFSPDVSFPNPAYNMVYEPPDYNLQYYHQPFHHQYPDDRAQASYMNQQQRVFHPDGIRFKCSLLSFVNQIPNDLKESALMGPRVDIVEAVTGNILFRYAPLNLFFLFFGPERTNRLVRTERNNTIRIVVRKQATSADAWRIIIAWMKRACRHWRAPEGPLMRMRVPDSLFAAITLVRTLSYMGHEHDASRMGLVIMNQHFKSPLTSTMLKRAWGALPKRSKYRRRLVDILRKRLVLPQAEAHKLLPDYENVIEWVADWPELRGLVPSQARDNVIGQSRIDDSHNHRRASV